MTRALVRYAGSKPKCFPTQEQYDEWKRLARLSLVGPRYGACVDCTPQFQGEMIRQGLCENPHVTFRMVCVKQSENRIAQELQGYVRLTKQEITA